jgi:Fe-S cluster assembly ATP-binding protein
MLEIKNLHAQVEDGGKSIINGIDLTINKGEVHAIMGPNGSGKSSLSNVIAGHEGYEVTDGQLYFEGEDIGELDIDERAAKGIFLAFQYPVEIPGVSNQFFMQTALNSIREKKGLEPLSVVEFNQLLKKKMELLHMPEELLNRSVNVGFSGGEKKRNDVFQMAVLEPKLAILDETDSGLDIDALRAVADGINSQRSADRSFLVITHYQRLLDYVKPDFVHVLYQGKIVRSGTAELALELEENGYNSIAQ